MKAISLWQPWASLWCSQWKRHETRHWSTDYKGWLAVHAAKRFEKDHPPELATLLRIAFGREWYRTLPCGALVGMVEMIACHRTEDVWDHAQGLIGNEAGRARDDLLCGNYEKGRFAWERGEMKLFSTPIPYVGRQGFFTVPDDVIARAA